MAKNKDSSKIKQQKMGKNIVLVLCVIALIAIMFAIYHSYRIYQPVEIYSLPLIETQTYSQSDGEMHDVKTNVSFAIDKDLKKKYDEDEFIQITEKTISTLDYDKLRQPDGTDYMKSEIYSNISEENPDVVNEDFKIYVSGYDLGLVNGYLPGLVQEETINDKLNKVSQYND